MLKEKFFVKDILIHWKNKEKIIMKWLFNKLTDFFNKLDQKLKAKSETKECCCQGSCGDNQKENRGDTSSC